MKITPKRVLKAIAPYGALVVYRRARPHIDRKKMERAQRIEMDKRFANTIVGAKNIKPNPDPKIVVSLTSYGDRINKTAPLAVASLFCQSVMPDKIVLWLAHGEKPSQQLKQLKKVGLEIKYCEDIKSYKKLIPSLREYPNSAIITADDDVVYQRNWLKKTLATHKKNRKTILTHRARKITLNKNKQPSSYHEWPNINKNPHNSHLILPVGVGGILYPPGSLEEKVFDKELFMSLAPHGDDLWFWAMSDLKGTRRALVDNGYHDFTEYEELDSVGMWNAVNQSEQTGNDAQFAKILEHFPELNKNIGVKTAAPNNNSFPGSAKYWENRYAQGGNSGAGSYDNLAEFKAEVINKFVKKNKIQTVIEFGTGDGNQLLLAKYPHYIGVDVSSTAINICQKLFKNDKTKEFYTIDKFKNQKAELTMSLDVLYHLIEQDVFEEHIHSLFKVATKYVIIYATDEDKFRPADHVHSRKFNNYIKNKFTNWKLVKHIPNKYPYDKANDPNHTSWADFYIYEFTG